MFRKLFGSLKAWILWVLIILIIFAFYFVIASRITPSTNDAHLHAYTIPMAPQVPGRITKIYVQNNQTVKKGQPLFQVDPRTYQATAMQTQAQLVEAKDLVKQLTAEITQAKSEIQGRRANLNLAQQHYGEKHQLNKTGYLSTSDLQTAIDTLIDAKQQLAESQQALFKAENELGANINGINAHISKAEAEFHFAELHLNETTVYAPTDGSITNLYMHLGAYADTGEVQMALVAKDGWRIYANIKENNLSEIKHGDPVLISLNMYPGKIFHGTVTSIGSGVNLLQNLPNNYLPYIKKTHNWIRLAQRFPVQIELNAKSLTQIKPRTGASVLVTITTKHGFFWNSLGYFAQWVRSYLQFLS